MKQGNQVSNGPVLSIVIIGSVLIMDQVSKWLALVTVVATSTKTIVVTVFLNIVLVWNSGISFGLFNTYSLYNAYILVTIACVIILILVIWLQRTHVLAVRIGLSLVIGGAIGNILDRLYHRGVVDFLDFHLGHLHWPAFNIADLAVTLGSILLVISTVSFHRLGSNEPTSDLSAKGAVSLQGKHLLFGKRKRK